MPKTYDKDGLCFLYPDNWRLEEEYESQSLTLESPEGAFLSVTLVPGSDGEAIQEARAAMSAEYDEIEEEGLHWKSAVNFYPASHLVLYTWIS